MCVSVANARKGKLMTSTARPVPLLRTKRQPNISPFSLGDVAEATELACKEAESEAVRISQEAAKLASVGIALSPEIVACAISSKQAGRH